MPTQAVIIHVQQTRKYISLTKNKIKLKSPGHYGITQECQGHFHSGQDEDYENVRNWAPIVVYSG